MTWHSCLDYPLDSTCEIIILRPYELMNQFRGMIIGGVIPYSVLYSWASIKSLFPAEIWVTLQMSESELVQSLR